MKIQTENGKHTKDKMIDDPMRDSVVLRDASTLRALANPARIRILGLLRVNGKQTVSGICSSVSMAPGSVSYHLDRLERASLVERVDSPDGDGRKSWWQAKQASMSPEGSDGEQEKEASTDYLRAAADTYHQVYGRYLDERDSMETAWVDAAMNQDRTLDLTVDELVEMNAEFDALAEHWQQISDVGHNSDVIMCRVALVIQSYPWIV
jgi:DNA-binding transcriptional ArsR family regulator